MAPDDLRQSAADAALAAAALGQGRRLDLLSLTLLALALAALLLTATSRPTATLLALSAAAGLAQRYFAFRCDLDARIFTYWANRWSTLPAPDQSADLGAFDRALSLVFGMQVPPSAAPRPLPERIRGALRLLRHQSLALALQLASLLGAILWRLCQTGAP